MCGNACRFQCVVALVDNHVRYGLFQSVFPHMSLPTHMSEARHTYERGA